MSTGTPEQLLNVLQLVGANPAVYTRPDHINRVLTGSWANRREDRLVTTLDALAAVCTRHKEVTAATLVISSEGAILSIAQKGPVNEDIREHVESLWLEIYAIAKHHADRYRSGPLGRDDQGLMELKMAVYRRVYGFCLSKFNARLNKRKQGLDDFTQFMTSLIQSGTEVCDKGRLLRWFDSYRKIRRMANDAKKGGNMAKHALTLFPRLLDSEIDFWSKAVREPQGPLSQWDRHYRDQLKAQGKKAGFSFKHFIQKYYALHLHIKAIFRTASFNKACDIFGQSLEVRLINPTPTPSTPFEFTDDYINDVVRTTALSEFKRYGYRINVSKEVIVQKLKSRDNFVKTLPHEPGSSAPPPMKKIGWKECLDLSNMFPHPECTLIAHHYNQSVSSVEAFPYPYIGASKLTCHACNLFLEAFNVKMGQPFHLHLNGCHRKPGLGWVRPPVFRRPSKGKAKATAANNSEMDDFILNQQVVRYMLDRLKLEIGDSAANKIVRKKLKLYDPPISDPESPPPQKRTVELPREEKVNKSNSTRSSDPPKKKSRRPFDPEKKKLEIRELIKQTQDPQLIKAYMIQLRRLAIKYPAPGQTAPPADPEVRKQQLQNLIKSIQDGKLLRERLLELKNKSQLNKQPSVEPEVKPLPGPEIRKAELRDLIRESTDAEERRAYIEEFRNLLNLVLPPDPAARKTELKGLINQCKDYKQRRVYLDEFIALMDPDPRA